MLEYAFLLTRPSRDVTSPDETDYVTILISTHTPLAGRDGNESKPVQFEFISTHTPLAGRDVQCHFRHNFRPISTHTPLAGRDPVVSGVDSGRIKFLLTRPSRDVTCYSSVQCRFRYISTHTPLAGRDDRVLCLTCDLRVFLLTRPSRDVTLNAASAVEKFLFLLTRPSRDVTVKSQRKRAIRINFYSHAPRGT